MLIVTVDDSHAALIKEHLLALEVVLEITVLIRSDVVRFNVGEDTEVKGESCGPMEHEPLGRCFHDHAVAAVLHHLGEVLLDQIRLRRRVGCRDGP